MAKLSPLMIAPPLIFAGFVALAAFGMFRGGGDELPSTFIDRPAPELPDKGLPGLPEATAEMLRSGEVTLVNFWASWCPPCRAEHPVLMRLAQDGVRIVGVNFKDNAEDAIGYIHEEGDPFLGHFFDPNGRKAIDWGVSAPPETFIIDGDGTVLFKYVGPLVGSDYEQRFEPALRAALED